MLIRIAPDMFVDEHFDCVTVQEVRDEIFRTQKFKTKYPWRLRYKEKIVPCGVLRNTSHDYLFHLAAVEQILDAGCISLKTGRSIGLSSVDKKIAAYVTTYDLNISSTDKSLIDFVEQEFEKKNRSPLSILNSWIQNGLIEWDDNMQAIVEDWEKNQEPVQPQQDKRNFSRLTGLKYVGS